MQRTVENALFALLCFEINGTKLGEEVRNLMTPEMLPALFKLSKKHDLAHLIGDALDKNGLLPDGSEAKKRFLQERNVAIYRYEQIQYELEQICTAFAEAQIPFLPLKGSVLRHYYPQPWMRTSCDIDILIQRENLEKAAAVLKEDLCYEFREKSDHDFLFIAESGVHLELHYLLVAEDVSNSEQQLFQNIWQVVQVKNQENMHCEMPDEYFYCYHISHAAKHLQLGGCGVRPILDTWVLNHQISFDKDKRDSLLKQAGLLSAARGIENLAEVWFSNAESDSLSERLGEYILTGGVYGTLENKMAVQQAKKKNKFVYLLSRFFVPYHELKFKYPHLEKRPILYPFYTVKRWLSLMNRKTRNLAAQELNQTANYDLEKRQQIMNLLRDLGL